MTVLSFPQVVEHDHGRNFDDRCRSAVALHFARNGSPEGHRVEALETHIAALKEVVANAKAEIEQTSKSRHPVETTGRAVGSQRQTPGRTRQPTGRDQRLLATGGPKPL